MTIKMKKKSIPVKEVDCVQNFTILVILILKLS